MLTGYEFLEAAYMAKMMSGGGSVIMTDTLKIIDEAPRIATISFEDDGWKLVFKKVDGLTGDSYVYKRWSSDFDTWKAYAEEIYSALVLCVYKGNKLKWTTTPQFICPYQSNGYTFTDGTKPYLSSRTSYGIASGEEPNVIFVPNVLRITNLIPTLPKKDTTNIVSASNLSVQVNYTFDSQSVQYNAGGEIIHTSYSKNNSGSFYGYPLGSCSGGHNVFAISSNEIVDYDNIENDIGEFCEAVFAYTK